MPKYYFHMHINGRSLPDRRGVSFRDGTEACARAVRCTPLTLRKTASRRRNTYVAVEVSDGERALYVVRGKLIIEKRARQ